MNYDKKNKAIQRRSSMVVNAHIALIPVCMAEHERCPMKHDTDPAYGSCYKLRCCCTCHIADGGCGT